MKDSARHSFLPWSLFVDNASVERFFVDVISFDYISVDLFLVQRFVCVATSLFRRRKSLQKKVEKQLRQKYLL